MWRNTYEYITDLDNLTEVIAMEKSDLIKHLMEVGDTRPYKTIYLGTHDSEFHADELLATAVLFHELEPLGYNLKVIRTRSKHRLRDDCDIVYDVGGGRYDHHTEDKVYYPNGIPMAACGKILNDVITDHVIAEGLRVRLFYAVEAHDNGVSLPEGFATSKLSFVSTLNPTWEEDCSPRAMISRFFTALKFVRKVYERMLAIVQSDINAVSYLNEHAVPILDGKFIMLDRDCPTYAYMKSHEKCLGAIYPKSGQWLLRLAPTFRQRYDTKVSFPKRMCGLSGSMLEIECGIKGALFCHPSGFIVAMTTREGCYEMAKLVLDECTE